MIIIIIIIAIIIITILLLNIIGLIINNDCRPIWNEAMNYHIKYTLLS